MDSQIEISFRGSTIRTHSISLGTPQLRSARGSRLTACRLVCRSSDARIARTTSFGLPAPLKERSLLDTTSSRSRCDGGRRESNGIHETVSVLHMTQVGALVPKYVHAEAASHRDLYHRQSTERHGN